MSIGSKQASTAMLVPAQIPNLLCWFDATNGPCTDSACTQQVRLANDPVRGWKDLSDNKYHLNNNVGSGTWTLRYQNSLPAVVFDRSNYLFRNTTPSFSSSFTVIAAMTTLTALVSGDASILSSASGSLGTPTGFYYEFPLLGGANTFEIALLNSSSTQSSPPVGNLANTTYVTGCTVDTSVLGDPSGLKIYINDPSIFGIDPPSQTCDWGGLTMNADLYQIGLLGLPNGTANWACFECALWPRVLNAAEMTGLFNYLRTKWSIRSTHP